MGLKNCHPLILWRREKRFSREVAAKVLEVSYDAVRFWEYSIRFPSKKNLDQIHLKTGGAVTAEDMRRAYDQQQEKGGSL